MSFKQGDIVVLKSGGPRMTVLAHSRLVDVVWWKTGEGPQIAVFDENVIELYKETDNQSPLSHLHPYSGQMLGPGESWRA